MEGAAWDGDDGVAPAVVGHNCYWAYDEAGAVDYSVVEGFESSEVEESHKLALASL